MAKSANKMKKVPGMPHIYIVDRDHIQCLVDHEPEVFSRSDVYGGHPMSGLASFGPAQGDHRMIAAIAEDIEEAFRRIK